jgi:hypothetical protein
MKAVTLAVIATFTLGGAALAAGSGPGSANNAPAQELEQNGARNASQYGEPADTAPGRERGATTGSTGRSGPGLNDAAPGAPASR